MPRPFLRRTAHLSYMRSNPETSCRIDVDTYGHLFEGSDREAAERIGRLFGKNERLPLSIAAGKPARAKLVVMPKKVS